jgi:hypothetical protein
MIRRSSRRRAPAVLILLGLLFVAVMMPATPGPDPSTWVLIGLGDSLTHGTMDATNNSLNTANAYLQRAADSLAQVVGLRFTQPFLNLDGTRVTPLQIPTNVGVDGEDSFSIDGLNYYKRAGTTTSLPSDGLTADKSLPSQFADLHDAVLYPINVLSRQPVTQLQSAEWLLKTHMPNTGLKKTLIVYWVGNNDSSTAALGFGGANPTFQPLPLEQLKPVMPAITALGQFAVQQGVLSVEPYTASAIDRNLTALGDFAIQQTQVLGRLVNASNGLERHIFVLTLPYYSSIGYLMDSDDIEYYLRKIDPSYTVPASFKRVAAPGQPITDPLKGDRISLLTFGMMYALLDSGYSAAYVNGVLDTNGQQRDGLVLSEAEQQQIRTRIDGFNATLRSVASSIGPTAHVVEIGEYLSSVLTGQTKIVIGGKEVSRKWIRGSSFTFDGVHPGYTGQALIANFLVDSINHTLGINAPLASLETVFTTDPYIDHDNDGFAPGPDYQVSGINELLFLFKDPNDAQAGVQVDLPADVWQIIARAILGEITGLSAVVDTEAQRLGLLPARAR